MAAVRSAYDTAGRRLHELVERQREKVKSHPDQEVNGWVSELFMEMGYGFIQSVEGYKVYFHRNSVLNDDFNRLTIGTGVRFIEKQGEKGPQASTVQILDKPGPGVSSERD
jgi:cold shock CspA family protein